MNNDSIPAEVLRLLSQGKSDFIDDIICEAVQQRSSDIHFECGKEHCRVRMRIDGQLQDRHELEKERYCALVNQIKIRASMDISEKRLPQDGRISYHHPDAEGILSFDIRVSVVPAVWGEKVVMRLLTKRPELLELSNLGLSDRQEADFRKATASPHGLILVCGPTGSGKSTTLYATLRLLNDSTKNILTVEDPVEYTLEGINQVQVKEDIGLDFSTALKSFMRQDPDIIMVGEIRDSETASIAIRSSLTGHQVLSTLHTNSAIGIVGRLVDMGVSRYLLADTLKLVVSQRLVRLLCPQCKSRTVDFRGRQVYEACGCEHCNGTGYYGRKAIYEVIPVDKGLAQCIRDEKEDMEEAVAKLGVTRLRDSAMSLYINGETSYNEIAPYIEES